MPADSTAGFTAFDWAVVGLYFGAITLFGLWMARHIRTSGGYFLGERRLPWWVMVGQAFGTGTHAENPVAQAGAAFAHGFPTIWYQWKNMLITPFYWLMAPWYRRSGRTTVGEIIEDRYGRRMGLLYTLFAIAFFVFNQGAMLKGAGKIISIAAGGAISPNGVVVAMTFTFILYSLFGGLVASAYTDFVLGFLIIVMSFLLLPLGLREIGGFTGLHETLPPHFFHLASGVSGLDGFTIAMLALNGVIGITAQPHMLTMTAAGRTERAGRVGQTYGSMVKRFCTIGWALTGLVVAAMVVRRGVALPDPEMAFGYATRELLGPGLTGLMVSCVLAANMSTCSNFMVNTGALFTRNIYRAHFRPDADDRHLLFAGRLSGLALTLLGVAFGLLVGEVLQAFLFTETLAALMGIMFVGGFLWKRANRHGALASIVASFVVYYGLNWLATGALKLVYTWEPAPFGWALLAGCLALILVSRATPPEAADRVEEFFGRQRRSSDAGAEGAEPVSASERGQELLLLDLPSWLTRGRWRDFARRHREDLLGLLHGYAAVAALILVAWAVMRIGKG